MYALLKECLQDFRKNMKLYVTFELLYMIVTSFIWIPIITFIFKKTLKVMGSTTLLNQELLKMPLSLKGSFGLILIFLLIMLVIFIEIGVLIVLSQKSRFNARVTVISSIVFVVKRIPRLFGIDILQGLVFMLLLLPIIETPLSKIVTRNVNLELLFYNKIWDSKIRFTLYLIAALFVAYLMIRAMFSLHYIIIDGKSSGKAIRSSFRLTRKNHIRVVVYLILLNAVMITMGIIFVTAMDYMLKELLIALNSQLLSSYILFLSSYLSYLIVILITPVNVIFITRVYYYMKYKNAEVKDRIIISDSRRIQQIEGCIKNYFLSRRYLLLLIVVVYMTATFLLNYSFSEELFNWDIRIAAHRGYNSEPENSLQGIEKAVHEGIAYVELDVQITKDGVLVLNHDNTFKRVADIDRRVSEMSYNEIQGINLGYSTYIPNYIVRVPSLETVFKKIGNRTNYLLDIKGTAPYGRTVDELVRLIDAYELTENVRIQSFSRSALTEIREKNPDLLIGQILYAAVGNLSALDVDFFTVNQNMVSEAFVVQAHRSNREVWVWTVNTQQSMREIMEYDVDGIISDHPEMAQALLIE